MLKNLAASVAALALLSGCAIQSAQASEPVPASGRHSVVEMQTAVDDSRYLATMRSLDLGPMLGGADDATLVQAARNFCSNGADVSDLSKTQAVRDIFGIEPAELRVAFRVMAAYYCPEHLSAIG